MQTRNIIKVRASEILGTLPTRAIIVRVLADIGDRQYPSGLYLVQCVDDPLGIFGHVDSEGYIYSGPPTADGVLARFI